jgi:prefoldin subunit 5
VPPDAAEVSAADPERELTALKSQAESLQTTLSRMRKRIEELEAKPKQE